MLKVGKKILSKDNGTSPWPNSNCIFPQRRYAYTAGIAVDMNYTQGPRGKSAKLFTFESLCVTQDIKEKMFATFHFTQLVILLKSSQGTLLALILAIGPSALLISTIIAFSYFNFNFDSRFRSFMMPLMLKLAPQNSW